MAGGHWPGALNLAAEVKLEKYQPGMPSPALPLASLLQGLGRGSMTRWIGSCCRSEIRRNIYHKCLHLRFPLPPFYSAMARGHWPGVLNLASEVKLEKSNVYHKCLHMRFALPPFYRARAEGHWPGVLNPSAEVELEKKERKIFTLSASTRASRCLLLQG